MPLRGGSASGAAAIGDLDGDGAADVATGASDIHVAYRLAPGDHLDATLSSTGYPHEFSGLQFSGNLTTTSTSCVEAAAIQMGTGPGEDRPAKLAETNFQGGTEHFYYVGVRPPHAGTWSFFARWNGGPYFGIVQSPTFQLVVEPNTTAMELTAQPDAVGSGEQLRLTANMWTHDGTLPPGLTVRFFGSAQGTRVLLGTAQTDVDGVATFPHAPTYITTYQAEFAGTSDWAASLSQPLEVGVFACVIGRMTRFHHLEGDYAIIRPSDRIYYRTAVEPNRAGKDVIVYLWYRADGRWHQAGEAQDFELASNGSVTISLRGDSVERNRNYRMRTYYGGDRQVHSRSSGYSDLRVV